MFSAALGSLDERVWRFFVDHPFLISFAKVYTRWGVSSILVPLALMVGVALFAKYQSVALAAIPMLALQVNDVLTATSKSYFGVARPPRAEWLAGAAGGSFPSGHMANTTSLVVAVAIVFSMNISSKRAAMWVYGAAGVLISLMGWSRLALNVHWLSDVLAGWVLGTCTALGTTWIVMKLAKVAPTRRNSRQ